MIRLKYLLVLFLLFASTAAHPCSCFGTSPIAVSIATHPILMEGEVVSLEQVESPQFGTLTYSATLRVTNVLKGTVDAGEITVVQSMCYASLTPDDMQLHHRYVLPLEEPAREEPGSMDEATRIGGAQPGQYEMAQCAHSGLERIGDSLYTFEQTAGRERRLQSYMPYSVFSVWWRVANAGVASLEFLFVTLNEKYGVSALMLALLFGGAGVYFAARYRPWWLLLVLPLAIAFTALNLLELVFMSSQRNPYSWGPSLLAPLLIVGGWVLGRRTRRRAQSRAMAP